MIGLDILKALPVFLFNDNPESAENKARAVRRVDPCSQVTGRLEMKGVKAVRSPLQKHFSGESAFVCRRTNSNNTVVGIAIHTSLPADAGSPEKKQRVA